MLPTEPLSIGGVLDAGIKVFRNTFTRMVPLAAIISIPSALASGYMSAQSGLYDPEVDPELALQASLDALVMLPVIYVLLVWVMSSLIHRQIALVRGEQTSMVGDVIAGLKLAIPGTILMFLYIILATLGLLLLIVPGVIILVSMSLYLWVPQVEKDQGAWGALMRSHRLVWGGNWWRTATILSVVTIIGVVLSVVVYIGLGALAFTQPTGEMSTSALVLESFLNWLPLALLLPLTTAMIYVLYNDLLLRRDGGDLDARLSELGAGQRST